MVHWCTTVAGKTRAAADARTSSGSPPASQSRATPLQIREPLSERCKIARGLIGGGLLHFRLQLGVGQPDREIAERDLEVAADRLQSPKARQEDAQMRIGRSAENRSR